MSPPWWSSSSSHVLSLRVDVADDLTFSGQITRASLRSLEGVIMPNSPSNPDQHHRLKKSPAAEGAHVVGSSEVGIGRSHREDSLAGGQPEETDIGPHDPAVSINHTLASEPGLSHLALGRPKLPPSHSEVCRRLEAEQSESRDQASPETCSRADVSISDHVVMPVLV